MPYYSTSKKKKKLDLLDMAVAEAKRLNMRYGDFVVMAEQKSGGLHEYFNISREPTAVPTYTSSVIRCCIECGDQINPKLRRYRFCSDDCQKAYMMKRELNGEVGTMYKFVCAICGSESESKRFNAKFCSKECREEGNRRRSRNREVVVDDGLEERIDI